METVRFVLLVIIGLAVYFNIGFIVKTYYKKYVLDGKISHTVLAEFAAGPGDFLMDSDPFGNYILFLINIGWVMVLALLIITWLIWLVFAGGIVKLLRAIITGYLEL